MECMKIFKRNAIIITVILFVCVAVYLNWFYNKQEEVVSPEDQAAVDAGENSSEEGLFFDEAAEPIQGGEEEVISAESTAAENYFATVRLTRQQARDSAISTLREASELETASQTAKDEAIASITVMAGYTVSEAEMEALIMAKGFKDCVVFLDKESAIVTVPAPAEGLSQSAVARITDIVLSETDLSTEQIKIIEVK
jgi:stage III sporulation protein AH